MSAERDRLAALLPPDVVISSVPGGPVFGVVMRPSQATALADTLTQAAEDAAMRERVVRKVRALHIAGLIDNHATNVLLTAIAGAGDGGESRG